MSFRIIVLQLLLCCISNLAEARPQRIVVWEFVGLEVPKELLFSSAEVVRQEAEKISSEMNIRIISRKHLPAYIKWFGGSCRDVLGDCKGVENRATDADFQIFGNLFWLEGKYVLDLTFYESKTGKMLAVMTFRTDDAVDLQARVQNEVAKFLKTGVETSRGNSPQVSLFSSIATEIPSKEKKIKRLIWVEERRRELDLQFEQVRRYTEEFWQREAEKDWRALEPELNTGERHELLRDFVKKYDSVSVSVQFVDPETEKIRQENVALNIPKVSEARQQLFYRKVFYEERLVPAGGFQMGCVEEDCLVDESLAHPVRLSKSFYMMRGEINQELYEMVTEDNPSGHVGPEYPVENINWYDIVVFANQLSELEGLEKCYKYPSMAAHFPGGEILWNEDCNGWRLPTEAEWERAAFGGDEFNFSGSDFIDEVAWGRDTGIRTTQEGCGKRSNGYDLCDMSGNVSEWVWDACHDRKFSKTVQLDPIYNSSSQMRRCYYLKGGSYKNTYELLRIPSLKEKLIGAGESPRGFFTYPGDGFRLVRTIQN